MDESSRLLGGIGCLVWLVCSWASVLSRALLAFALLGALCVVAAYLRTGRLRQAPRLTLRTLCALFAAVLTVLAGVVAVFSMMGQSLWGTVTLILLTSLLALTCSGFWLAASRALASVLDNRWFAIGGALMMAGIVVTLVLATMILLFVPSAASSKLVYATMGVASGGILSGLGILLLCVAFFRVEAVRS